VERLSLCKCGCGGNTPLAKRTNGWGIKGQPTGYMPGHFDKGPKFFRNRRGAHLKFRYGMSLEEYEALLKKQDNKCAICREPFTKTPHTDHSYETGQVRGILCVSCNVGMGLFKDSPDLLKKVIAYLETPRDGIEASPVQQAKNRRGGPIRSPYE